MFLHNHFWIIAIITILSIPIQTLAHPGRTDSYGCHTCRTNCPNWGLSSGEYHCHNAKTLPQPEEPIRSRYGENGTGYTEPAPEYKKESVKTRPQNTTSKNIKEESKNEEKQTTPINTQEPTTSTTPFDRSMNIFSKMKNWFTKIFW